MSQTIPISLRRQVRQRAGERCEYCLIPQDASPYTHEIDHLTARKHGGQTVAENLALACLACNRHKGSDLTAIDPLSGDIVPLFNPRTQLWEEHFTLNYAHIVGLTAVGRATIFLLALNAPEQLARREALMREGLYP